MILLLSRLYPKEIHEEMEQREVRHFRAARWSFEIAGAVRYHVVRLTNYIWLPSLNDSMTYADLFGLHSLTRNVSLQLLPHAQLTLGRIKHMFSVSSSQIWEGFASKPWIDDSVSLRWRTERKISRDLSPVLESHSLTDLASISTLARPISLLPQEM